MAQREHIISVLLTTDLPGLLHRGKVRDTFDLGDRLLIVASDRMSAFDVVMNQGIPDKGRVLTMLSAFWFERTASIVPNHLIAVVRDAGWPYADVLRDLVDPIPPELFDRSMIVRKAQRFDMECVARGYLAGSGWEQYKESGTVCGVILPPGLRESDRLPEPIFTPTSKADAGHDEPISYDDVVNLVGAENAAFLRDTTIALYQRGAEIAERRGIILADTKFEFGTVDGEIILIDEALTPDSSRFWPADGYTPGTSQPSFDKQPLRDWLSASGWNKMPPPPDLPDDVVSATRSRYLEAYRRITGEEL